MRSLFSLRMCDMAKRDLFLEQSSPLLSMVAFCYEELVFRDSDNPDPFEQPVAPVRLFVHPLA